MHTTEKQMAKKFGPEWRTTYARCIASAEEGKPVRIKVECRGDFFPAAPYAKPPVPEHRQPKPAPPPPPAPLPVDQWPRLAKWVRARRQPGEKGVGDTLARLIDGKGGAVYKRLYKRITGHDCGCGDRQARLNAAYAYAASSSTAT